jgi:hypothetical protein
MSDEQAENKAAIIQWGPCCFCAEQIAHSKIDPCRLTVETEQGKWQTWFCHAACFKERLVQRPELLGFLDPAHF